MQEREKRSKEAELNQNLLDCFSATDSDCLRNQEFSDPLQIFPEISRDKVPSNLFQLNPNNRTELRAACESLAITRKRCEELDRALNQVHFIGVEPKSVFDWDCFRQ